VTVRRLLLVPPAEPVSRPTRVRLRWPGGDSGPVTVGADGRVELPRAVRTAQLRIDVLAAAPPVGATAIQRRLRAVGIAEVRGLNGLAPVGRSRAAGLAAPCGALTGMLGARRFALAVSGRAADFEAGRPLRARGCGAPLAGVAGTTDLVLPPTPAWRIDLLRLASPAPDPLAVAAARPGRVVDQGKLDGGRLDGARVSLREPATLVLGESYAKGWRARCDGRSLGAPVPVDGYANGWDAPADCRSVEFSFAPDATVRAGYWISIAAVALLLLGLAGAALRRRRDGTTRATEDEPAPLAIDDAPQPWPWRRAASMAVAAGLVLGFCFAIRLGILVVPFVFLVLTHGVAPRRLIIGSAALLGVVVPALYLALSPSLDRGGYDFAYALDHIAAHWVGVAGVVLWMVAIARGLGPAVSTATPPTPAPEQPGAAAGSAPPSPRRSG
jgi:hypothetical protein